MSNRIFVERRSNPIAREEWEDWLDATPGFSVTDKIWGTNPRTGKPINIRSESAGKWERTDEKKDGYFQYHEGKIAAIDPDEGMVAKLHEIADAFGASVVKEEEDR